MAEDGLQRPTPHDTTRLEQLPLYDNWALMEDFARISGFREFYAAHRPYYQSLVSEYQERVDVRGMWTWLEERFPQRYETYRVVSSPLLGDHHNEITFRNRQAGYEEIVMFVPIVPPPGPGGSDTGHAFLGRALFTEIDHAYVNPVSDRRANIRAILRAMDSHREWNSGAGGSADYGTPVETFNEYMTWAVFNLYAHDTYDADLFAIMNQATVHDMGTRGFPRFGEFNDALLRLYQGQPSPPHIPDLFPQVLRAIRK